MCTQYHDVATKSQLVCLFSGADKFEGQVEVFANVEWGIVCDAGWGGGSSRVV